MCNFVKFISLLFPKAYSMKDCKKNQKKINYQEIFSERNRGLEFTKLHMKMQFSSKIYSWNIECPLAISSVHHN